MASAISTYFFFTRRTFLEDKKLFVLDWSLASLKASSNEIKYEIKSRLENLQVLLPRVFLRNSPTSLDDSKLFLGLSGDLSKEIYSITFHQKTGKTYQTGRTYLNRKLIQSLKIPEASLLPLTKLDGASFVKSKTETSFYLLNRSLVLENSHDVPRLSVLTLVLKGSFLDDPSSENLITVDLNPDFLVKSLRQSELAELYIWDPASGLVSHPNQETLFNWKKSSLANILTEKLSKNSVLPREVFEADLDGHSYLLNLSSLGIGDLALVSQIKKEDAFQALNTLAIQSLQVGLFIISLAFLLSILFSAKLTENIHKLEAAAREVGAGNLDIKLGIQSGDEIQKVATTFEWMTERIVALLKETAEKARMEEELATASLIQKTILTPPTVSIDGTEVVPYYKSASECGGDLWDVFLRNNKLTVLLGDATGHGAPAAIVTAVVKSCVSTLNTFHQGDNLNPSEILKRINSIVYQSCKGELLMTMSVAQLDLETGILTLANAGHEAPLHLKAEPHKKPKAEALFVRGERLGFHPQTDYESLTVQLTPGDTVLIYSDGVSEAQNPSGAAWGERALRKVFSTSGNKTLSEIKQSVLSALETFAGGKPQQDDITFVLFGWKRKELNMGDQAA